MSDEPTSRAAPSGVTAGTTYVALLRGINVGRAKQVSMTELRAIVEQLGYDEVRTLLRSGNVVFRGPPNEPGAVAARLEQAIETRFAMNVRVVIRIADELAAAIAANPIPEAEDAGSSLHVMFLEEPLSAAVRRSLAEDEFPPDVVRPLDREVYVWYRNGMSGSKTAELLGRRMTKALFTDRNWNTVKRLDALARET